MLDLHDVRRAARRLDGERRSRSRIQTPGAQRDVACAAEIPAARAAGFQSTQANIARAREHHGSDTGHRGATGDINEIARDRQCAGAARRNRLRERLDRMTKRDISRRQTHIAVAAHEDFGRIETELARQMQAHRRIDFDSAAAFERHRIKTTRSNLACVHSAETIGRARAHDCLTVGYLQHTVVCRERITIRAGAEAAVAGELYR